jgi:uncharacterized protein (DUF924 family)
MGMAHAILKDIHRYWFGELTAPDSRPPNDGERWFKKSDETDQQIRETYGGFLDEAAAKNWDLDSLSREETVALVVLFDQFPRNLYRTTGQQFAYDAKAREISQALLATGKRRFFAIELDALSLTYQHHEDQTSQDISIFMAADLAVNGPVSMRDMHRNMLDFSTKHRDLIRKFGRFPHRNEFLGRESTAEELAFIKDHGRGY